MQHLITLAIAMLICLHNYGQLTLGIKAGVNYSIISTEPGPQYVGDQPIEVKYTGIGQDFGLWVDAPLGERFAARLMPGISLRRTSRTLEYYEDFSFGGGQVITEDEQLDLTYLETPISLLFHLNDHLELAAGPSIAFLLGGTSTNEWAARISNGSVDHESTALSGDRLTKDLRKMETGAAIGCDYRLANGLRFGAGWMRSFSSIEDDKNTKYTSRLFDVLRLSIGYTLLPRP